MLNGGDKVENPIPISYLNDFIFCPVSIYFHSLDLETDTLSYQEEAQIKGTNAHAMVDNGTYSDKSCILQNLAVYSNHYHLVGKIDVFDMEIGVLRERKRKIKKVYDGYIFQLYAQYFCLIEMGYDVKELKLHSMVDNKNYDIPLPQNNQEMLDKFEMIIKQISEFQFETFEQNNIEKCKHCIYEELCYFSILKESL